eukprot:superscaffoldBa00000117_g1688
MNCKAMRKGEHHARINTGPIRDPYWVWLLSIDLPTPVGEETLQALLAVAASLYVELRLLKSAYSRAIET